MQSVQKYLEGIPHTFYILFWLYTHDFLFVSKSITSVLGYPISKFQKHGLIFFQTITPQHLIKPIYDSLHNQARTIEKAPDYIAAPFTFEVEAAVLNATGEEVPVKYQSVILDARPTDPVSHLLFCSWIDTKSVNERELAEVVSNVKSGLEKIHELYKSDNPEKFRLFALRNKITDREKEVAALLSAGLSTKEISDKLDISFNTVESHRKNLLSKFDARNTAELIHKYAVGII